MNLFGLVSLGLKMVDKDEIHSLVLEQEQR